MSHNSDQSTNHSVFVLPADASLGQPSRLKTVAFWIQEKEAWERMEIFNHEGLKVAFMFPNISSRDGLGHLH